jgi:hypothetical protein
MDRIETIMDRGRRAKAVLEDATVTEAMDHISGQLQAQWRATTAKMTEHRESLFHQVAALDAIKAQLHAWANDAKFEQDKLAKEEKRRALRLVR